MPVFSRDRLDAVIFDLDGVVTDTAAIHEAAWKETFDELLRRYDGRDRKAPFSHDDYRRFVDGRPRVEGIRRFLAARGIQLPEGRAEEADTIEGLAHRKNARFLERLQSHPPGAIPGCLKLIEQLNDSGYRTAVVTASRNGRAVLEKLGLHDRFDVCVDGNDTARCGLAGKPAPDAFLHAAQLMRVEPRRCAVVEDAIAGLRAARAGGFGLVVAVLAAGVERASALPEADAVFADLADARVAESKGGPRLAAGLPSALEALAEILASDGGREPIVLLDYDGTLTPIVDRPQDAHLDEVTRDALRSLCRMAPVAIVSGRGLQDLQDRIGLIGPVYVGEHGFDIADGMPNSQALDGIQDYLPRLDSVERLLRKQLESIDGALVERKKFSMAVHFRLVKAGKIPQIRTLVRQVLKENPELKSTPGKRVIEIQPAIDWHKGKAVESLLERLDPVHRRHAIYIGDDRTDEDAFAVLEGRGTAILVRSQDSETSAHYVLEDTVQVTEFIRALTEALRGR